MKSGLTQKGLTLLEMIVVLMLTAMIATILLQAVTFMLGSYGRVVGYQNQFSRETMSTSWYRNSLATLVASLDSEFAYRGDARKMSGYTLSPVLTQAGVLTKVSWYLENNTGMQELWYQESAMPAFKVYQWQADSAEFSYKPVNGAWSNQWPVESVEVGYLPVNIKLQIISEGQPRNFSTAVKLRNIPMRDYRDLL